MTIYWCSFQIDSGSSESVLRTVSMLSKTIWCDTPGFAVFQSPCTIDRIAEELSTDLDPRRDFFLLSRMDGLESRIFGRYRDPDIHDLMRNWIQIA